MHAPPDRITKTLSEHEQILSALRSGDAEEVVGLIHRTSAGSPTWRGARSMSPGHAAGIRPRSAPIAVWSVGVSVYSSP